MPKVEIDYSNTIIYKITCKDPAITDVYVGHTTNFVQRKHAHKQSCTNAKTVNYRCKLYDVIRNNGGWDNWKMEIINFFKCHDHYEARKREQEYFISLHATLNSIEPMPKPKPKKIIIKNKGIKQNFYCDVCKTHCVSVTSYETHNETNKHKKKCVASNTTPETTNPSPKVAKNYLCEKCDYVTSKKSDFNKHLVTTKHINTTNYNNNVVQTLKHVCKCGKTYSHRASLFNHKKKCDYFEIVQDKNDIKTNYIIFNEDETPSENMIVTSSTDYKHDMNQLTCLVIEVVKNNSEFQKQMFDMCKNMQANIVSNCNNNNNNTTNNFNLQVFLNEYCKDAMNISEFVDSFDLELSDLENVGRVGYIEGISNIIINKIKDMDVNKRPIHCSDLKREVIYIKDDDVWEREDADNSKFRKVIKKVAGKNIGMLTGWQERYPECMDIESDYNDIYIKLMQTAIGPSDTAGTEVKIMKKVMKHIVIDKKMIQ